MEWGKKGRETQDVELLFHAIEESRIIPDTLFGFWGTTYKRSVAGYRKSPEYLPFNCLVDGVDNDVPWKYSTWKDTPNGKIREACAWGGYQSYEWCMLLVVLAFSNALLVYSGKKMPDLYHTLHMVLFVVAAIILALVWPMTCGAVLSEEIKNWGLGAQAHATGAQTLSDSDFLISFWNLWIAMFLAIIWEVLFHVQYKSKGVCEKPVVAGGGGAAPEAAPAAPVDAGEVELQEQGEDK